MVISISIRGIGIIRHQGDTIWVTAVLTDEDGAALTPTTQTVTLRDPSGNIQATDVAPTLITAGTYESKLIIAAAAARGLWSVRWIVTVGADQETEIHLFTVEAMT